MTEKQMEDVAGDGFAGSGDDNTQLIPGKSLTGAGFVAGSVTAEGSGSSNESGGSEVSPLQMELGKFSKKCQVEGLAVIIISGISFSIAVTFALIITIYFGPPQVPLHGAVVCESKVCSDVGAKILKKGGTAVDAAIATAFCMGYVHPHTTGLGGAGYMVVRFNKEKDKNKQMRAYDFMGTVPAETKEDNLVAVPGFLMGLKQAHVDYGNLKWQELIQPTIDLANDKGLNISKELAIALAQERPEMQEVLISKGSEMAELLETLKTEEGVQDFYNGILAQEIVNSVKDMAIEDLNRYSIKSYQPITTTFKNVTVASCTAPCSGPLVLTALNIMSNFTFHPNEQNNSLSLHRLIEALKFTYATRPKMNDPWTYPDLNEYVATLLSKEFGKKVNKHILHNKTRQMEDYFSVMNFTIPASEESITIDKSPPGSSHIAVFGENEDQVSLTTSLGSPFGSKIKTNSGILLNNLLTAFNVAERENNAILLNGQKREAGIRPVTFLAPAVTFNSVKPCALRVAIGVTGNLPGLSALIQTLVETVAYQESLKDVLSSPRVHAQPETENIWIKGDIPETIVNDLEGQGHTVDISNGDFGTINVAAKIHETVQAIGYPSGDGDATVY